MSLARKRKLEEELKKIEESYKFYSPLDKEIHVATYHPRNDKTCGVIVIHENQLAPSTSAALGKWAQKQMKRGAK